MKRIILTALLFIMFISLGTVCAQDNITDTQLNEIEDAEIETEITNDINNANEDILTVNGSDVEKMIMMHI